VRRFRVYRFVHYSRENRHVFWQHVHLCHPINVGLSEPISYVHIRYCDSLQCRTERSFALDDEHERAPFLCIKSPPWSAHAMLLLAA
jgi:hypothetical protein